MAARRDAGLDEQVRAYLAALAERDREPAGAGLASRAKSQRPSLGRRVWPPLRPAWRRCGLPSLRRPKRALGRAAGALRRPGGDLRPFQPRSLAGRLPGLPGIGERGRYRPGDAPGRRVTLMTLHNAKGTEYPVVILIGVEEDHLPLWTTLEDEGQVREERRVFYVGLTRAQRQIYLTSARHRGDAIARAPSRFAYELPPEYVRRYEIGLEGQVRESRRLRNPRLARAHLSALPF